MGNADSIKDDILTAVMLAGPLASVAIIAAFAGTIETRAAAIAMAILWSPAPFALPALLTQSVRDGALPGVTGVRRALTLIPHLAVVQRDRTTILSLLGWAALLGALPLL